MDLEEGLHLHPLTPPSLTHLIWRSYEYVTLEMQLCIHCRFPKWIDAIKEKQDKHLYWTWCDLELNRENVRYTHKRSCTHTHTHPHEHNVTPPHTHTHPHTHTCGRERPGNLPGKDQKWAVLLGKGQSDEIKSIWPVMRQFDECLQFLMWEDGGELEGVYLCVCVCVCVGGGVGGEEGCWRRGWRVCGASASLCLSPGPCGC